jgi:hypothetical protein
MGKHLYASVAVSLLIAGALVGCGRAANTSQPGGSVPASTTPEPTPNPTPSAGASGSRSPSGQPNVTSTFTGTKSSGQVTIRGQVEEGVEAGCVLLKTDDGKAYLLVGGDRALISGGGRLEVVGEPKPDLMTTCQQGTPFEVAQVRRI